MVGMLGVSSVVLQIRQHLRDPSKASIEDLDHEGVEDLKLESPAILMESVPHPHEHRNYEHEQANGEKEHRPAEHHTLDSIAPRVVPIDAPSHWVNAAHALELWARGLKLRPHAQGAPLEGVRGSLSPPHVDEQERPNGNAKAEGHCRVIVGRPAEEVDHAQDNADGRWPYQPLIQVAHEKKVQPDAFAKIVAHLVDLVAPRERSEPVLVEVPQLVVFVQGEVMDDVLVVHQLPNVDARAIVVAGAHDIVEELYAVGRPENGVRLGIFLALLVAIVDVALIEMRDHASVAIAELAAAHVIILVFREGGQILRFQLELVTLHLRDLAQMLLVDGDLRKYFGTVARVIKHQDQTAIAHRCDRALPLDLPRLHLVALRIVGRPQSP
mmetsp:Transcript_49013/g.137196  ORF Transcript_49013/g.137196 Transcript_49013/m.137196 type:complete len:383 (+) Transcript_49013:1062-2210(+)